MQLIPSTLARIALIFAFGAASYYCIEEPAMKLRAAWEKRIFRKPEKAAEAPPAEPKAKAA